MARIEVVQGDLLAQTDCDAIVNPANGHLRHGGGLARIIADAADPPWVPNGEQRPNTPPDVIEWRRDHVEAPLIATGDAYATHAGALPFKVVVHAVGPIYGGGHFCEAQLLASAHREAYAVAAGDGVRRLAVPAISCGIFGYPVKLAARVAVRTVAPWTPLDVVRFVLFSDEHYEAYQLAAGPFLDSAAGSR